MLARLETIDGVVSAAVDHRGELLRLSVSDESVLRRARLALAELGYEAQESEPSEATDARWYSAKTARELSREEARIIADRVVPPFARDHDLADPVAMLLASAVAVALFECFAAHTFGNAAPAGSLRNVCSQAVVDAATPLVGADAARDLAASIETDLREPSGDGEP